MVWCLRFSYTHTRYEGKFVFTTDAPVIVPVTAVIRTYQYKREGAYCGGEGEGALRIVRFQMGLAVSLDAAYHNSLHNPHIVRDWRGSRQQENHPCSMRACVRVCMRMCVAAILYMGIALHTPSWAWHIDFYVDVNICTNRYRMVFISTTTCIT